MPDNVETIPIFKRNEVVEKDGHIVEINDEFVASFLRDFQEAYGAKPYRPPLTREHKREGLRFGKVLSVSADDEWVYAEVEYKAYTAELRRDGLIEEFSPGFGYATDAHEPGKEYSNLLAHLSFVSEPRQKNLEIPEAVFSEDQIPVTFSEIIQGGPMATEENQTEEKTEEVVEAELADTELEEEEEKEEGIEMQEVVARLSALEAQFAELKEDGKEDKEEEDEMSELSEVDQLKAELAEYKRKDLRNQLDAKITDLDDETFDHLVALRDNDETLYEKTVITLSESKPSQKVQKPVGKAGAPVPTSKTQITLSEAKAEAEEKGLKGAAKITYLQEKGVIN